MRSRFRPSRADVTFRRPLPIFRVALGSLENPPSRRPIILFRSKSVSQLFFSKNNSSLLQRNNTSIEGRSHI
ncbi:hypothetical protein TNCV_4093081 [Trichonephila clavipes]|nr:hypothetical protein TNCV_4093081 [Trichonephila clavipes]